MHAPGGANPPRPSSLGAAVAERRICRRRCQCPPWGGHLNPPTNSATLRRDANVDDDEGGRGDGPTRTTPPPRRSTQSKTTCGVRRQQRQGGGPRAGSIGSLQSRLGRRCHCCCRCCQRRWRRRVRERQPSRGDARGEGGRDCRRRRASTSCLSVTVIVVPPPPSAHRCSRLSVSRRHPPL